ncbi:MAG: uroporphyrinogen decarboxylase family protein [Armatimonadota bacterium]
MLDPVVEKRIMSALNHEEGDRVPIWDVLDNRGIVDHICPGWTNYDEAMVKVYHTLEIDLCRWYGSAFDESQDGIEDERDGIVHSKISGRSWWRTHYPIQSINDLKTYKAEPLPMEHIEENWIPFVKNEIKRFEPYTMFVPGGGCGFHAAYGLMGQELFSYAIYDDPINVERILEIETETALRYAKAAAKHKLCPIYFIGDDIAYKGALLFSPEYLRKTFIKSLAKVIEPVKAAGIKVIFHSDGYVMDILDDMIDAGIDGLNPIEPLAGMDIGFLKKKYSKNLVLTGNVDCSQLLPFGSTQDVIEATKKCLKDAGEGGGLFIGSSSEIIPSIPVDNILAFYDTCREYGKYPLHI